MYDSFWSPGDRVKYYLEEVCGFCDGIGMITGRNGQTIVCPVCHGDSLAGANSYAISIIEHILIDASGVWYYLENGDIVSQGRLINRVEESEPKEPENEESDIIEGE